MTWQHWTIFGFFILNILVGIYNQGKTSASEETSDVIIGLAVFIGVPSLMIVLLFLGQPR